MPPPRPPGPPPIGANPIAFVRFIRAFGRDPVGFVDGRFRTFGDTYFTMSGGAPLYVSRDPEVARDVLVQRAADFEKRPEDLEAFLGQGLLVANGETWRRQRRRIQPAFARDRLRAYASIFARRARTFCERHPPGTIIDAQRAMTALTLEIVSETLFDHDIDGDQEALGRTIDEIQEGLVAFLPGWIPTPGRIRQALAMRRLDRALGQVIAAKRKAPGSDVISQLLAVEDGAMSDRQLRDEVVTLFAAGHETTALALTWTIRDLAADESAQERLRAEVQSADDDDVRLETLEELRFTEACLLESMRLHPPAYAIPRRAVRPTRIGPWELEAQDEVVVWPYHMHRDGRWFTDPDRWQPERFVDAKPPFAFMPFGAGQRACIGRHFAMIEAKVVLAMLARHYRFEPAGPRDVGLDPKITLRPKKPVVIRLAAPS